MLILAICKRFFTFFLSSFEFADLDDFSSNDKERESLENKLNKIFISNEEESSDENKGLLSDEEDLNNTKELSSIEIDKGRSDIHLSFRQISVFDNIVSTFIFFCLTFKDLSF